MPLCHAIAPANIEKKSRPERLGERRSLASAQSQRRAIASWPLAIGFWLLAIGWLTAEKPSNYTKIERYLPLYQSFNYLERKTRLELATLSLGS